MAAAIKALNARIRANPVSDYLCSTRESPIEQEEGPVGLQRIGICRKTKSRISWWSLGMAGNWAQKDSD